MADVVPRSIDRGPIEARYAKASITLMPGSVPRSIDRGPIEADRLPVDTRAYSLVPRSIDRGPIEALTPWIG